MKQIVRIVFLFIVVLAVSGCSAGRSPSVGSDAEQGPRPVAIRAEMPREMTLERRIPYVGTVFARQEVQIIARIQGTLVELPVQEGDAFSAGNVLARLDSPETEAAVSRLQAEVDYWRRRYDTDRRLVDQGALAPEQADSSERAYRTARAGLAEAQAQLAKTVVTAPFHGTVLDWPAEIGQPVMPGQPLILIGDATREIRVDVIEEDLGRGIEIGTAVELQLSPGRRVDSSVAAISPTSSGPARTFSVTIPIPATGAPAAASPAADTGAGSAGADSGAMALPRKGASIRTEFIAERQKATVAVPTRAIADRDGRPHIYLVSDDRVRRIDVSLGISQDGWIAAVFDWNGIDPVAVTNVSSLRDGAAVYAVTAEGGE